MTATIHRLVYRLKPGHDPGWRKMSLTSTHPESAQSMLTRAREHGATVWLDPRDVEFALVQEQEKEDGR